MALGVIEIFDISQIWQYLLKFMKNSMVKKGNINNAELRHGKPYFETESVTIYQDDIPNISAIPPNSIDLIVTSPHTMLIFITILTLII